MRTGRIWSGRRLSILMERRIEAKDRRSNSWRRCPVRSRSSRGWRCEPISPASPSCCLPIYISPCSLFSVDGSTNGSQTSLRISDFVAQAGRGCQGDLLVRKMPAERAGCEDCGGTRGREPFRMNALASRQVFELFPGFRSPRENPGSVSGHFRLWKNLPG